MKELPKNAKKVFEGILFDVYQWEQKMFDGSVEIFEKVVRIGSVQLICVVDDKIILLEEEQPSRGKFLGVPGGMIDKGEMPIQAAKKELLEELGMESNNISLWFEDNFGNKVDWSVYYYIVKDCKKIQEPQLEPGEKITSMQVNFDEFLQKVESEKFRNKGFREKLFRIKHTPGELEKFKKLLFE